MNILKISENSLKVMLTAEDMTKYALDFDTIENDRQYSVSILREILRHAGEKCGFSHEGSKFFVQLYASLNGECEIFVHRIGETVLSLPEYKLEIEEENSIASPVIKSEIYVYSFESITHVLQVCRRLQIAKYYGDSLAYKENGGKTYFLILTEHSPLPEEHGGKLCNKNTTYYISEHCKLICNSAVERLGGLI